MKGKGEQPADSVAGLCLCPQICHTGMGCMLNFYSLHGHHTDRERATYKRLSFCPPMDPESVVLAHGESLELGAEEEGMTA